MHVEFATFKERRDRSAFVARRFTPYLKDSVLDVGCDEAPLRSMLNGTRYCGVDVGGSPDIRVNLDSGAPLPFPDRSFGCVLCIETLEHLDNLHAMFAELARVASKTVIVSLPNPWRDARRPIERGRGGFAHYGLPLERPVDRHKWFFNFTEARDFLVHAAARHGLAVEELFGTEQRRGAAVRLLRRIRYPGERYANRYVQTVWAVMRVV